MKPRSPIAPAAVTITRRNSAAVTGFDWLELRAFALQADLTIGKIGRLEFLLAADLVEALSGARSRPWTEADTEAELEAALEPSSRRSAGAR